MSTATFTPELQIKAKIKRLRESVERLEAFTALQIDRDAVRHELVFVRQMEYAIGKLIESQQ